MKKADFLLIACLLLIGAALLIGYRILYRAPGGEVQITIAGEVYQTLPLNQDATIEIPVADGSNTLTISNGYADMTEADCPDQLCVRQKKISHAGETLVCLPHKVVVKILHTDKNEEDTPDAFAY